MKKIAMGNTAEVYEYDERKVCKLFFEGYSVQSIQREFHNARFINKLSIMAPKVYDLIEINGRHGLIYEELKGHDLLEEIIQNAMNAEKLMQLIKILSDIHKEIIKHRITGCMDYKDFLKELYRGRESQYADELELIGRLPDSDYLCHGDFHPGNVWRNEDGTLSIIDFMNVCHGPREYDIARTYYLLTETELPEGCAEEEKALLQNSRNEMGRLYLHFMECKICELDKYLTVIRNARRFEK